MTHDYEFNSDHERQERCGFPEVIYAEGKSPEQVVDVALDLLESADVVLATRANATHEQHMRAWFGEELQWFERSGVLVVDRREDGISGCSLESIVRGDAGGSGNVVVCCAGTSDLGIAEEAVITARVMGSCSRLIADVGVAGVHRLLKHEDELREARVIVAVAGMEGALPTIIAGLVDVPVIAVPTSVGYGAAFDGLAALLTMMNSCAGGVSVVNIDNGFGGGQVADRINRPPARFSCEVPRSQEEELFEGFNGDGLADEVEFADAIDFHDEDETGLLNDTGVLPAIPLLPLTPAPPSLFPSDNLDIPSFEENPTVGAAEEGFLGELSEGRKVRHNLAAFNSEIEFAAGGMGSTENMDDLEDDER